MTKVKVDCYWVRDFDVDYDKPVEVYIDRFPETPTPEGTIRFVVVHESALGIYNRVMEQQSTYNYLLTYHEEHLQKVPNSYFFLATNIRVDNNYKIMPKEFGVSTVVGNKAQFVGHRMRQELYHRQDEITIPKRFYLSGNKWWGTGLHENQLFLDENCKDVLWDTQFHIAIENVHINNYFSEKILDCFVTKTVPIYMGASNIGNFFNTRGIIICHSLDELIKACNNITPNMYGEMSESIEENRLLAQKYYPYEPKIQTIINTILHDKCSN